MKCPSHRVAVGSIALTVCLYARAEHLKPSSTRGALHLAHREGDEICLAICESNSLRDPEDRWGLGDPISINLPQV